jgi:hypothetical protein
MKKIFLTVDTECHDINLQNKYIWGKIGKEPYGLERILILGKELNIPINFFVDITECKRYGVSFIKSICNMIELYGQHVYIHLHPNYISNDDSRTFLWQYSAEEQEKIIKETIEYYHQLFPGRKLPAFRAGRYGVDNGIYDKLSSTFGKDMLDISYCTHSHNMCHVNAQDVKTDNRAVRYRDCILFPNTRFISFDLMGKKKYLNLDTAECTKGEFKEIINKNKLNNITLTMHSWNFIKSFYFIKGRIWAHQAHLNKFRKMVTYAKNNGYEFCDIERNFNVEEALITEEDEILNLSLGINGKIKALFRNFIRFHDTARLSPKYFHFYVTFYGAILFIFIILLFLVL